jgi:NAD(P)-dependent dehydrogenase (short-subunit alcohol dehydrogenase family)
MDELAGRTAVVTGGGGLLGRGLAIVFARNGMNVVVADIDEHAAEVTAEAVERLGRRGIAVRTDVADPASVELLAERAYEELGAVHVLCNSAGAKVRKPFVELTREDWQRVMSVQWEGTLNGILAFLPRLIEQGGARWIVNTASMAGVGRGDMRLRIAPYVAAKFAVVGMSEVMAPALAEHGIGVSILCPGLTVADPSATRRYSTPAGEAYGRNLLGPEQVAQEVVHALRERRLYVFPHRSGRAEVEARHGLLLEGFRQAERTSPPLA